MKTRTVIPIAAAALSLVFATGCEKRADQTSTTGSETRTTSATDTPTGAQMGQLSEADKEFLTKAAQGGMAEMKLGADVAKRGTSPEVRAFANRMVTDHGKASAELQALAAKKSFTLPTDVSKDHKEIADKLAKLSGSKLDEEYAEEMVKDHEKDVKEFQTEAQDGKDPDVKSWAAKLVPVLQDHLKQARDLHDAEKARGSKAKTR